MSSIIEEIKYDIFISYRQKDNKHDGWVTEFVNNLKGELGSTFKEEISVYFDINPHDGLLETHDVDASLKDKLKCLVFIPIISRTYCDPRSFAWEHEFKAFVEQASGDKYGLKVKLPGGNVASRVLPVRIHDLDDEDIKLTESVLGGFLRGVEFIYKAPGVNRPLTPTDDEEKNLNKTRYRNQINKVANAVKEIISGLMIGEAVSEKEKPASQLPWEEIKRERKIIDQEKPSGSKKMKLRTVIFSVLIVAVLVAVFVYPQIFKRDTFESLRAKGKIAVAVMPFQNMTNDTTWNPWQDGLQNELITSLSSSEELKVRQAESTKNLLLGKGLTNYASITPFIAGNISQKLNADVFVYGSIKETGKSIRVNAQLIDSRTQDIFKSFQIDGIPDNIIPLIDSLSAEVKNFLIISVLQKTFHYVQHVGTNSPEAFRDYIYGMDAGHKFDWKSAREWMSKAVAADSNFVGAQTALAASYSNYLYNPDPDPYQQKKMMRKLYEKRDMMNRMDKLNVEFIYAQVDQTPVEQLKYARQLLDIDDQQPEMWEVLGFAYQQQYDKAVTCFRKEFEIYKRWGTKPKWVWNYANFGDFYQKNGQYRKGKMLYKKALSDFPDSPDIIGRQAVLARLTGNARDENRYIEKYESIQKGNSMSDAFISQNLGLLYIFGGVFDKAEGYCRQAVSLEPENHMSLNILGWVLINEKKIEEGLELVDKALVLSPDNYEYLDTKGWGLYMQGNNREALDILQKSWDLRRKYSFYNDDAFLHLEAAKKAVAGQKNN